MGSSHNVAITRLGAGDRQTAKALFTMMAEVFGEPHAELSDAYLDRLLARQEFWAIAARVGERVVGGLTAHVLPMTRDESREIFIFDIAVEAAYQRQGVGRELLQFLKEAATQIGISQIFVAADVADVEALDFYRAVGATEHPVALFTL